MNDSSTITLSAQAVEVNLAFLRKHLHASTKISAVIKANAYGHGIEQVAPLFEAQGINHFSVFDYHEAVRTSLCLKSPATIMIMGWVSEENLENAMLQGFEFFVFSLDRLNQAAQLAKKLDVKACIHLEVETGMNRSGLNKEELEEALDCIDRYRDRFEVKGLCSHMAGPESVSNYLRIQEQLEKYKQLYGLLKNRHIKPAYRHIANSAGAFVYPEAQLDLVRIGIMLYGFWSSTEVFIHYVRAKMNKQDPLQRLLRWSSKVMSVKEVAEGEFVGYGLSYLAQRPLITALVPVGYSMGYNRSLGNKGRVLINGYRCGVIGTVNMNMIIVDVTNVSEVMVGDEVVIIGKQGELEIKVSAFSNISNELNYEVLAHLSESINRIVE
ncbi:MAG: alanine racemase [Marinilabiliaceae bacterium]|nr:alanine racemase [Marinilabiliaceae bacterium]